ncbi:DNA cytosine methyltransferase (plasmid) [Azospirillum sp. HJ39]|uniref:DNA cytosine methyltransferase n=1 Tax=Azospirillum sp. HJ39 TaxID=3159496 RepID=UPI003557ABC3
MRFLSVCSGIEAASVAWEPMGMRAVAFAEVEAFPSAVLAHRFPHVPNLGDMTKIDGTKYRGVDVVVGGCPCQSFSVAGLRKGLEDARGNLTIKFINICDDADPDYIVYENVPGLLSSKDNAFGCFISGLAGGDAPAEPGPRPAAGKNGKFWRWNKKLGTHVPKWSVAGHVVGPKRIVAWRCLDAQFFGLAQRRLRVFVVACPRNGADPRSILLEQEGVRWNPPPRRKAGQEIAGTIDAGSGGAGENDAKDGRLVIHGRAGGVTEFLPQSSRVYLPDGVAPAIQAVHQRGGNHAPQVLAFGGNNTAGPIDVATAVNAHSGPHGRLDFESETFIAQPLPFDTTQITSPSNFSHPKAGDACHPIAASAHPPAIAYRTSGNCGAWETGDRVDALTTGTDPNSHLVAFSCKDYGADAGEQAVVTFQDRFRGDDGRGYGRPPSVSTEIVGTLETVKQWNVATAHIVRRLTPTECERLQGFPDGHTDIIYRGKPAADGPRYKGIGNSTPTQVMRWIGLRIVASYWRQKSAARRAQSTACPPHPTRDQHHEAKPRG